MDEDMRNRIAEAVREVLDLAIPLTVDVDVLTKNDALSLVITLGTALLNRGDPDFHHIASLNCR